MADPAPTTPPPPAANAAPKAPPQNPALRMLGLPGLPKKLPSRNWMIFWTVSSVITAAIIYDKREKKRAIAKWSHAVEHLAQEPLPDALAQQRKLTIYLSSPPGDGLRVAQDHYTEYVKPILAASGLDWEFVQGRRDGDVRAYVAERVRRLRRERENNGEPDPDKEPTKEDLVEAHRRARGIKEYDGVRGDVVIGRHTWKEYIRGLHEGWLGPLAPPPDAEKPEALPGSAAPDSSPAGNGQSEGEKPAEEGGQGEQEEQKKPRRPPQPKPHNTPADYPTSTLPAFAPDEFAPAAPIREPHLLGFLNTPTRLYRFFNRRKLADEIGREVAAACLCTYREFRQLPAEQQQQHPQQARQEQQALHDPAGPPTAAADQHQPRYEQQTELEWEEKDWVKTVWKEEEGGDGGADPEVPERVRARPVVMDPRVAARMRRFQLRPEDEDRAARIVVPEEEVEGWVKGRLRQLYRWSARKVFEKERRSPLGDADV